MCYEIKCRNCGEAVDIEFWEEHKAECGRLPKDKVPAEEQGNAPVPARKDPSPARAQA